MPQEATELRIENIVYNRHGEFQIITHNSFQAFRHPTMDGNPSGFKPVPLTEDILIKCGFTKIPLDRNNPEEGYYYSLILLDDKSCDLSLVSGDKNGIFEVYLFPYENIRFQYLHQVQNIYQSITGKELEINL